MARGHARWKVQLMADGRLVQVHGEVILVERRYRLHARTISEHDIERAYAGAGDDGKYARDRIELFCPSGREA